MTDDMLTADRPDGSIREDMFCDVDRLEPRFGMGFVEGLVLDSRTMFCNPVTSQPPGAVL